MAYSGNTEDEIFLYSISMEYDVAYIPHVDDIIDNVMKVVLPLYFIMSLTCDNLGGVVRWILELRSSR